MLSKTIVYGDSFSCREFVKLDRSHMWYANLLIGEFVDRTAGGKSAASCFLQSYIDAVEHNTPIRIIIGVPPVAYRLTTYLDGWFEKETVGPDHDLTECEQHFSSHRAEELDTRSIGLMHPTLMWSEFYKNCLGLMEICEKKNHQVLITHMSTNSELEWINKPHPMVKKLCISVEQHLGYINESHSCHVVCKTANIKPYDFSEYGWGGHHGKQGQRHFGDNIERICKERKLWN